MKKLALILVAVFGFTFYGIGQFQFGAGASFTVDSPSWFGVQGKVLYDVNETWRGSGSFSYYFESSNIGLWSIDLDAQYKLLTIGEDITLSPFAGLDISSLSFGTGVFGESGTEIGINLGASFIIPAGESLKIYAEPKLILGGLSSLVISGGVLF